MPAQTTAVGFLALSCLGGTKKVGLARGVGVVDEWKGSGQEALEVNYTNLSNEACLWCFEEGGWGGNGRII